MQPPKKRSFAKKPEPETNPLPEFITADPLWGKNIIRGKKLERYQQQMTLLFTPELMRIFFTQLRQKLIAGDQDALSLFANIFGFVQKSKGINIVTNIQQNQVPGGAGGGPGFQFDRIVRELATTDTHEFQRPPAVIQAEVLPATPPD